METATAIPKILVLEDDIVFHEWLEQALGDVFELAFVKTTREADTLIASSPMFDVVLVDEHLENEKGSAWIKQRSEKEDYPISFVLYSGTETEESLVKSLACGASDFLVKPMPPSVLIMRIEKLLQYQVHTKKYKNKIARQHDLIDQTQNQAHLYSQYMPFGQKLNNCKTAAEVEMLTLEFLNDLSLYGCLAIHESDGETVYKNSTYGVCSPIEMQVMELLKGKETVNTFENRQYFYHPDVSLMIYNLPKNDHSRIIIMDLVTAAVESIGFTLKSLHYQDALLEVQQLTQQSLASTEAFIHSPKILKAEVIAEITSTISANFNTLDLTDEKQEFLRYIINNALTKYNLDPQQYNVLMGTFKKTLDYTRKALENKQN